MCPVLSIDNGTATYSNDSRIEGTVATYSCDGDLVLVGNETRTCGPRSVDASEVGVWDGSDPMCGKFALRPHICLENTINSVSHFPMPIEDVVIPLSLIMVMLSSIKQQFTFVTPLMFCMAGEGVRVCQVNDSRGVCCSYLR